MYKLSEETKRNISKTVGIPYEKLITMDDEEVTAYIEKKTGKKLKFAQKTRFSSSGDDSVLIDCGKFSTIEDVDKKIDKIAKQASKNKRHKRGNDSLTEETSCEM